MNRRIASWRAALAVATLTAGSDAAAEFSYNPPGTLVPGSGTGRVDETVYVPGMRFPIESAPAYANSQVWGRGGSQGPGGGQCDAANYSYPWWDNFCESRSWDMPLCPSGTGHQGQDIRAASCAADVHWAVAAEAGTISSIGSYSVTLVGESGTRHRYLHMANSSLQVSVGDRVVRGQRLGRVSNEFGGTPTTVHLHYDIFQNVAGVGGVYVPTYMSLVTSYEELVGSAPRCEPLGAAGGVIDDGGPCVTFFGPAASWRYVTGAGHDGDLRWTYAWDRDRSNWARYDVPVSVSGSYVVEVHLPSEWAQSRAARYTVVDAGGEREIVVDQTAVDGWALLGTLELDAGRIATVTIGDDTGEDYALRRQLVVDAIRVSPAPVDEPSDPAASDAGPSDAGVADVEIDTADDAGRGDAAPEVVPDAAADGAGSDGGAADAAVDPAGDTPPDADDPGSDTRGGDRSETTDGRAQPVSRATVRGGCAAGGPVGAQWLALVLVATCIRRRGAADRSSGSATRRA